MKDVLIVLKDLRTGNGIASCLMNYYNQLLNKFNVTFLLLQNIESPYTDIVKKSGGNIIIIPTSKLKYSYKTQKFLNELFKNNHFDIIHINIPGPYGALILKMAQKNNIKSRIYHSHNPKNNLSLKSTISSTIYNRLCVKRATDYLACSKLAGRSIFGNEKFEVLKNCIDAKRFQFNPILRDLKRKELKIDNDTIVIGSVGRAEKQKNPIFALSCFKEYLKKQPNAIYIWIGMGSLLDDMKNFINENDLSEKVKLLGIKDNIEDWYSAMDLFFLPSKFEGLGIVYIEAQASGLPVLASTEVPEDIELSELVNKLDLNVSMSDWAQKIYNIELNTNRLEAIDYIKDGGYDKSNEEQKLSNIYEKIYKKNKGGKNC